MRLGSLAGILVAGAIMSMPSADFYRERQFLDEPIIPKPRGHRYKGPGGPVVDSTPLTKREKRKLRSK